MFYVLKLLVSLFWSKSLVTIRRHSKHMSCLHLRLLKTEEFLNIDIHCCHGSKLFRFPIGARVEGRKTFIHLLFYLCLPLPGWIWSILLVRDHNWLSDSKRIHEHVLLLHLIYHMVIWCPRRNIVYVWTFPRAVVFANVLTLRIYGLWFQVMKVNLLRCWNARPIRWLNILKIIVICDRLRIHLLCLE
jgi:hypothetical protein